MNIADRLLTRLLFASYALITGIGAALAQIPPTPTPTPAPTPAPEPASLALLAVGMGGTIIARRLYRRRRDR